jgi:hypothetical protein
MEPPMTGGTTGDLKGQGWLYMAPQWGPPITGRMIPAAERVFRQFRLPQWSRR